MLKVTLPEPVDAKFVMLMFGQSLFARRQAPVAVARDADIETQVAACVNVGVGLQAELVRADAIVADAQIVHIGGAEYLRIADADVLGAKLGRESAVVTLQRIVDPGGWHDHVAREQAVVVVEAVIDAAQVLVGVEDLVVRAHVS